MPSDDDSCFVILDKIFSCSIAISQTSHTEKINAYDEK